MSDKPLDCKGIPLARGQTLGKVDYKEYPPLTSKEAKEKGYLVDPNGYPWVAYTGESIIKEGDFSRTEHNLVIPVYTDLEEVFLSGLLHACQALETLSDGLDVTSDAQDILNASSRLKEIITEINAVIGPHKRQISMPQTAPSKPTLLNPTKGD